MNHQGAIDVREYPFPEEATKPGQSNAHCYRVIGDGFSIGIMYAVEPFQDDGACAIHCSISYLKFGRPAKISGKVLTVAQRVIEQQKLTWPWRAEKTKFENGPFAGVGLHIWELPAQGPNVKG